MYSSGGFLSTPAHLDDFFGWLKVKLQNQKLIHQVLSWGGRVFVNSIFLGIEHAFTPRRLACRSGLVKSVNFRAITEDLESIPFLGWIPVVDDHLDRHLTAPDKGLASGVISPRVQTPMGSAAIGFLVGRYAKKRRTGRGINFSIL